MFETTVNQYVRENPGSPLFLVPVKREVRTQTYHTLYGVVIRRLLELSNPDMLVLGSRGFLAATNSTDYGNLVNTVEIANTEVFTNKRKSYFNSVKQMTDLLKSTGKLHIVAKMSINKGDKKVFGRFTRGQPDHLNEPEYQFYSDIMNTMSTTYYDNGEFYFTEEADKTWFCLKYGAHLE